MGTDRQAEIERRASAQRFRLRRAEYAAELRRLLGERAAPEPLADPDRAAALAAEFVAAVRAAEPHDWALVAREWPAEHAATIAAALHDVSGALGARPVWLISSHWEPQAAALDSDVALDNPLGFAAAGDYELRLLDRELPAGLWLGRHSHHFGPTVVRYTWELNVWGEPWLSAATRALRGAG